MLRTIQESFFSKVVVVWVVLSFLTQLFMPTVAYALTGGPSQPEVESFEPYNTDQMVDPFTGDLNYNIPLFTVPGPNGGYPLNIAYHAGITMEQEASWTGLGWNINPGAITRQTRGIPDDYNGAEIEKKMSMREDKTTGIEVGVTGLEVFGLDFFKAKASQKIYYNSYRGMGIGTEVGLSVSLTKSISFSKDNKSTAIGASMSGSAVLSLDSQGSGNVSATGGLGFTTNLTENSQFSLRGSSTMRYNSKQGRLPNSHGLGFDVSYSAVDKNGNAFGNNLTGFGANFTKAYKAWVPFIENTYDVENTLFSARLGIGYMGGFNEAILSIFHNSNTIENQTITADGYMYASNSSVNMSDFNRQYMPGRVSKDSDILPIPNLTPDAFNVNGQGVGGGFMLSRNDMGSMSSPKVEFTSEASQVLLEANIVPAQHYGFEYVDTETNTYSGAWKYGTAELDDLQYDNTFEGLKEPYYFRSTGEKEIFHLAPDDYQDNIWYNDDYILFDIEKVEDADDQEESDSYLWIDYVISGGKEISVVEDLISEENFLTSKRHQNDRAIRQQNMQVHNTGQINSLGLSGYYGGERVYSPSLIGGINVTNPDGSNYVYGQPAYNIVDKTVTESVSPATAHAEKFADVTIGSNSPNFPGESLKSEKILPAYAHSYMLTRVYSPDYIDLTGDGPTDDDLGYYVNFNYDIKSSNYNWRSPSLDGTGYYSRGLLSNPDDNKASYTQGVKQIHYLEEVETKTHKAIFYTSPRKDGKGVVESTDIANVGASNSSYKLDSIQLVSKRNPDLALQTVHFEYNYELCKNVMNNENYSSDYEFSAEDALSGKLTLKKLWFTYRNSQKGAFSSYEFDYNAENEIENPSYDLRQMDIWGSYKKEEAALNDVFPYVRQGKFASEDESHSAWNLKSIELPSGATMDIEYEQDRYAYVQDRKPMQMFKVIDVVDDNDVSAGTININSYKLDKDKSLVIEFDKDIYDLSTAQTYMDACMKGINNDENNLKKDIYIKALVDLNPDNTSGTFLGGDTEEHPEYIEFYGVYESHRVYADDNGKYVGAIKLKSQKVEKEDIQVHPITKAALQHFANMRTDLHEGSHLGNFSLATIYSWFQTYYNQLDQLVSGYEKWLYDRRVGRGLRLLDNELSDKFPTHIRLSCPDQEKLGGGHRVSKITIKDNWADEIGLSANDYNGLVGKKYHYLTDGGKCSGVAAYEPVGNAENPFKLPERYSSDKQEILDEAYYFEKPIGEHFMPAAHVGYSRVITSSIHNEGETQKLGSGITVNEFHTAKDFPFIAKHSNLKQVHDSKLKSFSVPFFGSKTWNIHGYSQGYVFHSNDMHGKLKRVSSYAANQDMLGDVPILDNVPNSSVSYHYKLNDGDGYIAGIANKLDNTVDIINPDGTTEEVIMGRTVDFVVDENENFAMTQSVDWSFQANVDFVYWGLILFIPSVIPLWDKFKESSKTLVTSKHVSQNGILDKVEYYDRGSKYTETVIAFDKESGQPVVKLVEDQNGFNKYSFDKPAHWLYKNMKGQYRNQGAKFSVSIDDGSFEIDDARSKFNVGDKLRINGSNAYVNKVKKNRVYVENAQGEPIDQGGATVRVIKSGLTNQTSLHGSKLVSLEHVIEQEKDVQDNLQSVLTASLSSGQLSQLEGNNTYLISNIVNQVDNISYTSAVALQFEEDIQLSSMADFESINLLGGNNVELETNQDTYFATVQPIAGELFEMTGIIDASADLYDNTWAYNYLDVTDKCDEAEYGEIEVAAEGSLHHYGGIGAYRLKKNKVFNSDRDYTYSPMIPYSGTLRGFIPYYAGPDVDASEKGWQTSNEVTRYSPYGYELENKNPLGIYSSAVYGYDNSLPTIVANNASYFETAFDGFEDYYERSLEEGYRQTTHGHLYIDNTSLSDAQSAIINNQTFLATLNNEELLYNNWESEYGTELGVDQMSEVTLVNGVPYYVYDFSTVIQEEDSSGDDPIGDNPTTGIFDEEGKVASTYIMLCDEDIENSEGVISEDYYLVTSDNQFSLSEIKQPQRFVGGEQLLGYVMDAEVPSQFFEEHQQCKLVELSTISNVFLDENPYLLDLDDDTKFDDEAVTSSQTTTTNTNPIEYDQVYVNAITGEVFWDIPEEYEEVIPDVFDNSGCGEEKPIFYSSNAHTGSRSIYGNCYGLLLPLGVNTDDHDVYFKPLADEYYILSLWMKNRDNTAFSTSPISTENIYYFTGNSDMVEVQELKPRVEVEGWTRFEFKFKLEDVEQALNFNIYPDILVDDIRIVPFDGSNESFVYDPITYDLVAKLDDQHFATLYNYDDEGKLTQVKKETEKGIVTLKGTRVNKKQD